jgi:tRNA-splicing ligase RtcB
MTGTERGMKETYGSTCHGAGRLLSRHSARHKKTQQDVANELKAKGVSIRIGNPKLITEEVRILYTRL